MADSPQNNMNYVSKQRSERKAELFKVGSVWECVCVCVRVCVCVCTTLLSACFAEIYQSADRS